MNKGLSKFNEFKSKINEDREDDFYEDDDIDPDLLSIEDIPEEDILTDEAEDPYKEDMEFVCGTIRSLFSNSNIDVDVDYDGYDISIYTFPEKKEKMSSVLKIFDIVLKLKRDVLPQYESEFELYESKKGDPVFSFQFTFTSGESEEDDEESETEESGDDQDGESPFGTTNSANLF